MFKQASVRLATLYLGIIVFISVLFSTSLYNVSISELARFYQRQVNLAYSTDVFRDNPQGRDTFVNQRLEEFHEAKSHLISKLILINICILLGGGLLSYYFARQTLRPIEEAHKAQERFSADASHELRTPLAIMQTEIEVALMNSAFSASDAKKLLKSNLEEIGNLTRLTNNLLMLAHLKEQALDREKLRLKTVVQESIDRLSSEATKQKISIVQKGTDQAIVFDKTSLGEILYILLENAIKYTARGATVTVTGQKSHKAVMLSVNNPGATISKEDLRKVFDRFYRTDASRKKNGGFGLGLAIAKQLAELNGTNITVDSNEKSGTTFSVRCTAA